MCEPGGGGGGGATFFFKYRHDTGIENGVRDFLLVWPPTFNIVNLNDTFSQLYFVTLFSVIIRFKSKETRYVLGNTTCIVFVLLQICWAPGRLSSH